MISEEKNNNGIINFSITASLILIYFTACGGLWHIAYWGNFDINIFQYITITDVIKSYIYPFIQISAIDLIILLVGYPAMIFFSIQSAKRGLQNTKTQIQNKEINPTKNKKNKKWWFPVFLTAITASFTVIIYKIYIIDPYEAYMKILYLIGIIFGIFLGYSSIGTKYIKSKVLKIWLTTLTIIVLPLSLISGLKSGKMITENKLYKVVSSIESKSINNANEFINSKYLGTAGNKIFLSSPDGMEIFIINEEKIDYIGLKMVMTVKLAKKGNSSQIKAQNIDTLKISNPKRIDSVN